MPGACFLSLLPEGLPARCLVGSGGREGGKGGSRESEQETRGWVPHRVPPDLGQEEPAAQQVLLARSEPSLASGLRVKHRAAPSRASCSLWNPETVSFRLLVWPLLCPRLVLSRLRPWRWGPGCLGRLDCGAVVGRFGVGTCRPSVWSCASSCTF